jgi:uncharacterized protein YybS (DUF2232 family)
MRFRTAIISLGVILAATIPFWQRIPALSYLLEIALAILIMASVFENARRYVIAAAFLGFFLGLIPGLAFDIFSRYLFDWLRLIVPPLVLAVLITHGKRAGRSYAIASGVAIIFFIMAYIPSHNLWMEVIDYYTGQLQNWGTSTFSAAGYSQEMIYNFGDSINFFMNWIKKLLPGFLALNHIGQLFIAFLLLEWHYIRRDSYFPGFGPFIYWKIPERLLYLLAVALVVALTQQGVFKTASYNFLLIMMIAYAVCGLALVEYGLRKLRLPTFIKAIFYLGLVFSMHFGLIIPAAAGLVDSHFDFRKVRAHTVG